MQTKYSDLIKFCSMAGIEHKVGFVIRQLHETTYSFLTF